MEMHAQKCGKRDIYCGWRNKELTLKATCLVTRDFISITVKLVFPMKLVCTS